MGGAQYNSSRRGRKLKAILLFACFWGLISLSCAGRLHKLQVEKLLKRLNKPHIETIQSPDGDTIACVNISHQPAFDHPLLKDHKIQMKPSYHPQGLSDENKMSKGSKTRTEQIPQLWHMNGRCPDGTIPVRRTKKEDVLRANSVKRYGKKKYRSILKPQSSNVDIPNSNNHEHSIAYVQGDKYYGANAIINVWRPEIEAINDEFSLSQIWVLGGSHDQDLNSIEAGWQVNPDLYGDNNTRLFTYWTSDAYRATGCYNLLCSGFVQVNNQIAIGATINPVSSQGSSQYEITILIFKDPKTGDWWMKFGNQNVIGYWPSSLFSYLAESASMIQWGGEVVNSNIGGRHTSTQMGSGLFPDKGFGKSSYFRNIQVIRSDNTLRSPAKLDTFNHRLECYNIQTGKNEPGEYYFYYGGPGRSPSCE